MVGGPEPGAYAAEYLQSGADFVVFGEGEITMEELLRCLQAGAADSVREDSRHRFSWRRRRDAADGSSCPDRESRRATMAGSRRDRHSAIRSHLERRTWAGIGIFHHRARLPLQMSLVQPSGVRNDPSPAESIAGGRRSGMAAGTVLARHGVGGRRRLHHSPWLDSQLRRGDEVVVACGFPSNASRAPTA